MIKLLALATTFLLAIAAAAQNTFLKTEHVRFSPDGKQFVFSSAVYQSSATAGVPAKRIAARIGMMNIDGTNLKFLTTETPGMADASPVISSDGKKILFRRDNLRDALEQGDIFVINTDGTGLKQLTNKTESEKNPEFTTDSKGVVFIREYFVDMGKARQGELVYVGLDGSQEKVMLPKEMRVSQVIPLTVGRGGYLLACAETDDNNQPLAAGSMLAMASPDGEISPRSKMVLPGKQKVQIRNVRVVMAAQLTFYVHGTEGTGWFADDVHFKVTPGQTQKLTHRNYYSDISLSPDGKTGAQGAEGKASVNVWDFSNDQFSNKRVLRGNE